MLRRRGKLYYLDLYVDHKRYRESLKTTNKYLALDRLNDRRRELLAKAHQTDTTLADFKVQYLEWARTTKPASAHTEELRLNIILSFLSDNGIFYLKDITPAILERLRTWLKDKGRAKGTINRYLQLLRGAFYRAIDWGVYHGQNPLKKVKFYRESPSIRPLTDAQVEKVLEAAGRIAAAPKSSLQKVIPEVILFALNTGLRRSEILWLKWADLKGDEILVSGKGEKKRLVPLNKTAREILERQDKKSVFVFDIPNRADPSLLRRTTERIRKETGIDFHLHLCRHHFATSLLERGVDIVTISEILGHSKPYVSLLYSHTDAARKHRAVESLGHNLRLSPMDTESQ